MSLNKIPPPPHLILIHTERRKAAQACRAMEKNRSEIRKQRDNKGVTSVEVASVEETSDDDASDMDKKPAAKRTDKARQYNSGPRPSIAEAAASGCRKCIKELQTGEKTRKVHDDKCPRKFHGPGKPPPASPGKEEPEDEESELMSESVEETEEEEEQSEEESEEEPEEPTTLKLPAKRPRNGKHAIPLEVAAKSGCSKCKLELKTGEKTRNMHDDNCPRKWTRGVAAATVKFDDDAATPPPAEVKSAPAPRKRAPSANKSGGSGKKAGRPPAKRGRGKAMNHNVSLEEAAKFCTKCELEFATGEKTRKEHSEGCPRKWRAAGGRPPKGTPSPASVEAVAVRQVTKKASPPKTAKSPPTPRSRRGKRSRDIVEEDSTGAVADEDDAIQGLGDLAHIAMEQEDVGDEDAGEAAKALRGGGGEANGDADDVTFTSDDDDDSMGTAELAEEEAMDLRGGGETVTYSPSSTPKPEIERLIVPTPLRLGDDITYANNGRVQRSRKKPSVFDPQDVPAREWKSEGGSDDMMVEPEALRGGYRIKKEVQEKKLATDLPAPSSPRRGRPPKSESVVADTSPSSPPRRGRPPTKKTNDTKKENKKHAPIGGPRKPSTQFDCPVCLDLPKIKFCCYCACRICFNKFGKEQTMLCDECDQEYHTFCLGLEKIPDGVFECPACIADKNKKVIAGQRRKEREEKKRIEEENRKEIDAKKAIVTEKRKAAYAQRKAEEEERRRIKLEKRKVAYEKRKAKEKEMRAQGIPVRGSKSAVPTVKIRRKPGRPSKADLLLRLQVEQGLLQQQDMDSDSGGKRGKSRGRPRKDGSSAVPRKLPSKHEVSLDNLYLDTADLSTERTSSGRKISRTTFHDDVEGGGLMYKKPRLSDEIVPITSNQYTGRRSAAAAKSVMGGGRGRSQEPKKDGRRKPGARECMIISRKFKANVIEQKYFDVLLDYSQRGKVDHLVRIRERMDEHSRFLEAQLAGLEALVKEKGELDIKVPAGKVEHEKLLQSAR